MQFAGLKELLKKKKEGVKETAPPLPPSAAAPTAADPYAAAVRSALANKTTAADPAFSRDAPPQPSSQHEGQTDGVSSDGGEGSVRERGRKRSRSPTNVSNILDRETFEAQRRTMLAALSASLAHVSACGEETPSHSHVAAVSASSRAHTTLAIPQAIQHFLRSRYVHQVPERAGNGSPEEVEHAALQSALAELTASHDNNTQPPASPSLAPSAEEPSHAQGSAGKEDAAQRRALRALLHTLWYLTAAYWHAAILGEGATDVEAAASPTHQSAELMATYGAIKGWCFPVYLLSAHALPDVMRLSCGRETATCLEAWRAARRSVDGALELLAYLLLDYEAGEAARRSDSGATEKKHAGGEVTSNRTARTETANQDGSLVVPTAVRKGLHDMLCVCVRGRRDFVGARQAYTDLTMGTANWKLGLFSAGEVHMRRSVEKLERNRMSHLLNNELAMRLLHATRELVLFAERQVKRHAARRKVSGTDGEVGFDELFLGCRQ